MHDQIEEMWTEVNYRESYLLAIERSLRTLNESIGEIDSPLRNKYNYLKSYTALKFNFLTEKAEKLIEFCQGCSNKDNFNEKAKELQENMREIEDCLPKLSENPKFKTKFDRLDRKMTKMVQQILSMTESEMTQVTDEDKLIKLFARLTEIVDYIEDILARGGETVQLQDLQKSLKKARTISRHLRIIADKISQRKLEWVVQVAQINEKVAKIEAKIQKRTKIGSEFSKLEELARIGEKLLSELSSPEEIEELVDLYKKHKLIMSQIENENPHFLKKIDKKWTVLLSKAIK
ncbi:uncharacterized protein LOC118761109 [Octopus sinensis]|uniref:Uncharacterized protein LOC118761109 n=1 Tax=Octopus sinensis TaxID=2607531 RepID=A0A7E6EIG6_9MOLL|nr:uncharacterized protein LOC118761109 [Octopus sinensis]